MSENDLLVRAQGRVGSVLCQKYRLDSVLGVGGMAVVFAATHRNQKKVAIKVLHPELSIHAEIRTRFLREGYAANTVDHPGAVAVLDDDTAEDGSAFLVMERLDGDEVDRLWEAHGKRLDPDIVLAIANQLLDVLAAAHAKAIIHRDIKPSNLYVTREGTLKVLDFGIARVRDAAGAGKSATSTGMMLGTPAYMAPEQALGKTKEIDATSDIWSVGATMFALLSGRFVHEGESVTQLVVMTVTTPARSLATVARDVDPRIVALVDRALAFDRGARWQSASEMRDALRGVYMQMFGTKVGKEPLLRLLGVEPEPESGASARVAATLNEPVVSTPQPGGAMPVQPLPHTREMTARPSLPWESRPGPLPPTQAMTAAGAAAPPRAHPSQPPPGYVPPPGYAPGGLVVQQFAAPALSASQGPAVTAHSVSAEQVPGVPKRSAAFLLALIVGVGALVGGGVGLVVFLAHRSPAPTGFAESPPPAPSPSPLAAPVPSPTPSPQVPVPAAAPQTSSEARSAPPTSARTPAGAIAAPPSRAASPKANCDPPYTVDSMGHHHMKPECL